MPESISKRVPGHSNYSKIEKCHVVTFVMLKNGVPVYRTPVLDYAKKAVKAFAEATVLDLRGITGEKLEAKKLKEREAALKAEQKSIRADTANSGVISGELLSRSQKLESDLKQLELDKEALQLKISERKALEKLEKEEKKAIARLGKEKAVAYAKEGLRAEERELLKEHNRYEKEYNTIMLKKEILSVENFHLDNELYDLKDQLAAAETEIKNTGFFSSAKTPKERKKKIEIKVAENRAQYAKNEKLMQEYTDQKNLVADKISILAMKEDRFEKERLDFDTRFTQKENAIKAQYEPKQKA